MYEFGTLRPPSPRELVERRVPLEVIDVQWICGASFHECGHAGYATTWPRVECSTLELVEFHGRHNIPWGARLKVNDYGEGLALDWSHLAGATR